MRRSLQLLGVAAGFLLLINAIPDRQLSAQDESTPTARETDSESKLEGSAASGLTDSSDAKLQFSFSGTAWRDVIEWLAAESELALHVDRMPTGSFTYSDSQKYTPSGAIDRVNLFLLPQGFSLVRTNSLLSVIDLGDPRSLKQLETLAPLVQVDELAALNSQQVVKCLFTLGEIETDDAVAELGGLNLMMTPVVFQRTNRLLITDSVAKLQNVKLILDAFETTEDEEQAAIQQFPLKYISTEDLLTAVRPHLGLAADEMLGIDINLSIDGEQNVLYATGLQDKIDLLAGLIESLDTPDRAQAESSPTKMILKSHPVQGGDVELAYNVLQTLLTGQSVRLSTNEAANSIVALASQEVQDQIAQAVNQLAAEEPDFAVIPLEFADPYLVVSLLEQMLDLPDPFFDDDETDSADIRIDADPANRRLFVSASPTDLVRIREIIKELDTPDQNSSIRASGMLPNGGTSTNQTQGPVRFIGLPKQQGVRLLESAAAMWQKDNLIILFPSSQLESSAAEERVLAETGNSSIQNETRLSNSQETIGKVLAGDIRAQLPEIQVRFNSQGMFLQSEDLAALDELSELLTQLTQADESVSSKPVVYYLKYTRPETAIRMLAELLDGSDVLEDSNTGSLVNGIVSSGGFFFSSLVTSQNGTTTMAVGTITVVADPRLNRLIAQGTAEDIERIETFLKIIDKDTSITTIETYGRSHIIELEHSDASEVAQLLRQTYASRLDTGNGMSPQQAQGGGGREPRQNPDQQQNNRREGDDNRERQEGNNRQNGGRGGGNVPADPEPKMTIAVHEPSNSLIITAQEQLFREVEQLVRQIDERNARIVQVLSVDDANIVDSLRSVFGDDSIQTSPRGSTRLRTDPRTNNSTRRNTTTNSQRSPSARNRSGNR